MAKKSITKVTKTVKSDVPVKKAPSPKAKEPVAKKPGAKLEAGMTSKTGNTTRTFKEAKATKGGFGDSSYVARNFVDADEKVDSTKTVAKKKVIKSKNDATGKSVLTPRTSHY